MSSQEGNALNAIGTLIGYIGTEVATDDFFDRLLWPHRSFNGFNLRHVAKMALLMPMGGPLHKAALSTLDDFYKHGLFERHQLGHMLGTAFFRDSKLKYKMYGEEPGYEEELVRNGLWVRGVMKMPFMMLRRKDNTGTNEKGEVPKQKVRQKIAVAHLMLFRLPSDEKVTKTITIGDDARRPTLRTYLALCVTETSAIVIAILVAVLWRSAFAALWLMPLVLKLVSTAFTLRRDGLVVPKPDTDSSQRPGLSPTQAPSDLKIFEIRNPAGGFVVIEGSAPIILQFFRHHGHPIRSKTRELIQIALVVAFTFLFPIGLISSTLWMSNQLQKVWVGYQLYATLAMYIYRYFGGHQWGTTEEEIGRAFSEAEAEDGEGSTMVRFKGKNGDIGATLVRTCHGRFAEALVHMEQLIAHRKPKSFDEGNGSDGQLRSDTGLSGRTLNS